MKIVLVVPTYNEMENIPLLIEHLNALKIPDLEILVVDDASPDGTAEVVKKLQTQNKNLHLLVRRGKKGRGLAGIAGFKKALEIKADIIGEMDADLSHDPGTLPLLLSSLKEADIVLASRFVEGGDDSKRPFHRKIITQLANFYIRTMLGLAVRDCNSGYRCFKREALEAIDLNQIGSKGPSILQETLYKCHLKGFRIKEIPMKFVERHAGKSKLGLKQLLEGYTMILKLKFLKMTGKLFEK